MDKDTKRRATFALSGKILEIVDLDAPRSDVQGCAEALAAQIIAVIERADDVGRRLDVAPRRDEAERDGALRALDRLDAAVSRLGLDV